MKHYLYLACISFALAAHALPAPFCCHTKMMATSRQEKAFKQQVGILEAQCADNPGALASIAQRMIIQREEAIENGKQRQQHLEQLHAQLNNENDDSQDEIAIDTIIDGVGADTPYMPHALVHAIDAQYNQAYDQCYDESSTCAYEKAYLAYLCAQAAGYANGIRQQEIEKLRVLTR